MYVPESAGCTRASCSVWVPARGGAVCQPLAPATGLPPRLPVWSPQSWTPSLSLPTRQEEDVFSQGEGLAVLVPRDLGARVSTDVTGEGHAAVEDGGDLLGVQACDVRCDCPRGHGIKKDTENARQRGSGELQTKHRTSRLPAPAGRVAEQRCAAAPGHHHDPQMGARGVGTREGGSLSHGHSAGLCRARNPFRFES